ncbi:MAG: hypothetical protein JNL96_27130 [Planctomycetaceae bacterium]|nr:hypothetical protein [Planctomycetaceae bacterium]
MWTKVWNVVKVVAKKAGPVLKKVGELCLAVVIEIVIKAWWPFEAGPGMA